MSRRRAYSPATLSTMERFFQAFDACLANKIFKSKHFFCETYGIDHRHFYNQRKDIGRGYFEVGWMLPLIEDAGVSANWLLTGRGTMFVQ